MRILIDLQGLQESYFRGIGILSINLIRSMIVDFADNEYLLLVNMNHKESLRVIEKELVAFNNNVSLVPWYSNTEYDESDIYDEPLIKCMGELYASVVMSKYPDVILYTHVFSGLNLDNRFNNYVCINNLYGKIPQYAIVHDLIPLENPDVFLPTINHKKLYSKCLNSVSKLDGLFSNSDYTKGIFEKYFKNIPITTIYGGPCKKTNNELILSTEIRQKIGNEYILYAGGIDDRKNVKSLISAYAKLSENLRTRYKLVIVCGKAHQEQIENLQNQIKLGSEEKNVVLLSFVSDYDLQCLYKYAKLFVFPSLNEGLGLSPIESMGYGTATICSNSTPLLEVVGMDDATFSPFDIKDMTLLIEKSLTDDSFYKKLVDNAKSRAKVLTWKNSAKKLLTTLQNNLSVNNREKCSLAIESLVKELSILDLNDNQKRSLSRSIAKNLSLIKKRNIFIDITQISKQNNCYTGIQRVERSVYANLIKIVENKEDYQLYFLKYDEIKDKYLVITSKDYSNKNENWFDIDLFNFSGNDLCFCAAVDCNVVTTKKRKDILKNLNSFFGVRLFFIVYDLMPIQYLYYCNIPKGLFDSWVKFVCSFDGIIADSKDVAYQYRQWMIDNSIYNKDYIKIGWTHLGAEFDNQLQNSDSQISKRLQFIQKKNSPCFLMVGTIEPRKGHKQVLNAFEELWSKNIDVNLIIVGASGWLMNGFEQRVLNHEELNKHLFFLGRASDEELKTVYECSDCLVYASEAEGFGLPIIEAAYRGIDLIVRDIPVFREICGDNVTYFNGFEAKDIAETVEYWLEHKDIHGRSKNIEAITWKECSDNIWDFITSENNNYHVNNHYGIIDNEQISSSDVTSNFKNIIRKEELNLDACMYSVLNLPIHENDFVMFENNNVEKLLLNGWKNINGRWGCAGISCSIVLRTNRPIRNIGIILTTESKKSANIQFYINDKDI